MKAKNKTKKKNKFSVFLIIVDFLALVCFIVAYGPFSFFRNIFVTTAMNSMSHRYFAYVLYSEEQIERVLDKNKVEESGDQTDASAISFNAKTDTGTYESIYEEQVLKKDKDNDLYKIVDIKGDTWNGYLVVIYDASLIDIVISDKFGGAGEYLSTMATKNNAYIAMNASGLYTTYGNRNTGSLIKDGKLVYKGRAVNHNGGLIGFNKDNVLVLTKKSAEEAIKDGMDRAVEFGPFLVVNGEMTKFSGNGGWGYANRSAIGQRQDGIVLFIVINGRTSSSVGISMKELAELFVKYKAYNAANLDGGGSSALYAKKTLTSKGQLINNPVGFGYSGERYLPDAWMVLPSKVEEYLKENDSSAVANETTTESAQGEE